MNPSKLLIVEDEAVAAEHLRRLLAAEMPNATVIGVLQSIEECVEYFRTDAANHHEQPMPDIVFMDIHLADGLAFRVFESVDIQCPVVFTTAYDQYALEAFRTTAVEYLLKPIDQASLHRAVEKIMRLTSSADAQRKAIAEVSQQMRTYRSHFLIPVRNKLIPIAVDQIACLYLEDKITYATLYDGHKQIIDQPLDAIMEQLDPTLFFRANRQYIVAHRAIKEITVWPISKLALTLSVETPTHIIISKARVQEFKQWYTK